jgi:tRNA threonylcarbamoyladenosine biosynthesis protein TsaB
MKFVSFETATEWCSVALWLDGELVGVEERAGQSHAEKLLPMLDRLAAGAGVALGALEAVAFGAGPGSFTGLRIACGVAQGIALARGIPVIGISTLEAVAEESGAARVVACLDARMREVYYSAHERIDGKPGAQWREVVAPQCVAPAALALPPGDGWIGCGNGFAAYGSLGLSKVHPEVHPSAVAVARLAAPRLAAGEGVDAALAVPAYVRDKVAFTTAERPAGRAPGARSR